MIKYKFTFTQVGTSNPVLVFDNGLTPDISCARVAAGAFDFSGTNIPDAEKLRLFISPVECENQDSGEPVVASVVNQGALRVIGRQVTDATVSDFNMAEGVYIPMELHVY